jgi:NAD(P)-dependent dehydrogenase (short-subunit alcohol dehydrogenase family)
MAAVRVSAVPSKRFDLTGKVAVVTGGTGILGQHFCRALAEHGASVVIADLDAARCAEVAATIAAQTGARCLGAAVDVTSEASVRALADTAEQSLGPIDILHNNAASKGDDLAKFLAPPEDYDMDMWRQVMAVNLDGLFIVAREIGGRMARRGRGSIIQTSSIYGITGPDSRIYEGSFYNGQPISTPPVYSASKAGVVGLTKYLATHWGAKGVRVNTLTPGGVESGQNETFKARYGARVPLGRMADPQEMVGALVFLASDAASYITGQNIIVDGGLTAW